MNVKYFSETDTLFVELNANQITETQVLNENLMFDIDDAGKVVSFTVEHIRENSGESDFSYDLEVLWAMIRNLKEFWRFRALVWALVGRHLRSRYRGSVLGFFWSFLNPLCLMAVYSLVFKFYIRFDAVENYSLFMFAGLLPWIWFSSGLIEATASISSGGSLITKAMFPAHLLPLVSVCTNLANFLFALPLILIFMLVVGVPWGVSLLALPLVILVQLVFIQGLALALSAINVHFRDTQHVLGNLMTLWFFLCPIIYPVTNVPERFRFTLLLNPVASFTVMYQQIFLEGRFPDFSKLGILALVSLLVFILGNKVFNHYREGFAELI